jgi:hypothetical protein
MSTASPAIATTTTPPWESYPSYRDSGVNWLGAIPADWTHQPLKHVTSVVTRGDGPEYVDESTISVIN